MIPNIDKSLQHLLACPLIVILYSVAFEFFCIFYLIFDMHTSLFKK